MFVCQSVVCCDVVTEYEFPALFFFFYPNPALLFSFPIASVEPTLVRVPDVYQQDVTFTCTGKVNKTLVINKEVVWLVNSVETTDGVSSITDPMGISSTSELQTLTPSDSGTHNYTCVVIVAVVGDPVLQDVATALVDVTSEHIASGAVFVIHFFLVGRWETVCKVC